MVYPRPRFTFWIDDNGCFICTSHFTDRNGYPRCRNDGKNDTVARYITERVHGEIPTDMITRHLCNNPQCINPAHIKIGTQAENMQDRDKHRKLVS